MRVAILGFGTVGVGVFDVIEASSDIDLAYVLVRPGKEDKPYKVSDINVILEDTSVECVIEVMGGINPSFEYACAAINAGKSFVTSNKALVAEKGIELSKLAQEKCVSFLFSAACGGAVPYLHNLSIAVQSDEMLELGGILNGTTNFMLDSMQRKQMTYEDALKCAQNLGYAESDPTADVTGLDPLRKIMLACAVAYGKLPTSGLNNEGIDSFTSDDVEYIKGKGLTCRLLASAKQTGDKISAYVEPVLFSSGAPECSVLDNFNMAKYIGKNSGKIVFMGQGAGRHPTASAVVRDVSDIMSGRKYMMSPETINTTADNSTVKQTYLVRCKRDLSGEYSCENKEKYGDNIYHLITDISVSEMHSLAAKLRDENESVFFASVN